MTALWNTIAAEKTRDGLLELKRRGDDFFITISDRGGAGRILMASGAHASEDVLAELACRSLRDRASARVLVSGLGMGFTLRAALRELGPSAEVTVCELNEVVAAWCRGPLAELTDRALLDPRVTLRIEDVAKRIGAVARTTSLPRFDAIILDMYEGPQSSPRPNDALYGPSAVESTRDALAPGGVFAVWCEGPSSGFDRSLRAAGFSVTFKRIGHATSTHYVYLARRAATLTSGATLATRVGPKPVKSSSKPRRRG